MRKEDNMQNNEDKIINSEYADVMQQNYIDYAMSVIVARALPDVRDGLKPVQRRVLYDMGELGTKSTLPYRKCARIVGDTMGKYHPHGDSSIYDSLVVMAQDFKKEQPLVDGHGNFGSLEGDGAAAMRYTEARLQKFTEDVFLADLDKGTVDFVPNFDETEKEPEVLPAKAPNFLINGSEGIAVGMATSTPPHNISEVIDAEVAYLKNNNIKTSKLLEKITGPDFPSGGIIVNKDDLPAIYETGEGKIRIRGKVVVEKGKDGRQNLVITEIPYTMIGSGIAKFMSDVAALAESKKVTDIVDISNHSGKEGIRIVIELKKGADVENIENLLYQKTKLEDTFGVNMLAVCDGRPETMGLKTILEKHAEFLNDVNMRKYTNLLAKEKEKEEIQRGLIKAVDVIDTIIAVLRGSKTRQDALDCLVTGNTAKITFKTKAMESLAKKLKFTENQAKAILDMRLSRLIGLELNQLMKEHDETVKKIEEYSKLITDPAAMTKAIIKDLEKIKKEFARPRRTVITNAKAAEYIEAPEKEVDLVFLMDRFNYVKTIPATVFEKNEEAAREDNKYCIPVKSTGKILVFTQNGNLHSVKVSDIPNSKLRDKGKPLDVISRFVSTEEEILYVTSGEDVKDAILMFMTAHGSGKVVDGSNFDVSRQQTAATKLVKDDKLIFVGKILPDTDQGVIVYTKSGQALRFPIWELPTQTKVAAGARCLKLGKGDEVSGTFIVAAGAETALINEKEVPLKKIPEKHRDRKPTKVSI